MQDKTSRKRRVNPLQTHIGNCKFPTYLYTRKERGLLGCVNLIDVYSSRYGPCPYNDDV